ncbi:hypothetical protein [Amycolatopsis sp. Hca4]|uniref:hypothetical protein n=1 Tax=Amycolatopsis sp. Hca4 TaxID=2742131 RepID=UPI001591801B|nr:hypothetical protein [Amycolatopsis sp. Hca4]QKV74115.1 hypothetical protein HUT10_10305 [Amycolatopsis sp. Hca4]
MTDDDARPTTTSEEFPSTPSGSNSPTLSPRGNILASMYRLWQRWVDVMITTPFVVSFFPYPELMLLTKPFGRAEKKLLIEIGVSRKNCRRANWAMMRSGLAAYLTLLALSLWIFLALPERRPSNPSVTPIVTRGDFIIAAFLTTAMAVWLFDNSAYPRKRLLASCARCVRLVHLLRPTEPLHGIDLLCAKWLADPQFLRRRVVGLAWALTRDSGRLNGNSSDGGVTMGELLLWFAESPADRRRRPTICPQLGELITETASGGLIPQIAFSPAARFRSRSPRDRLFRWLRTFAGGALATGIFVAIVTAALRVWFK